MKNSSLFKKHELKVLETIYKIQYSQKHLMEIYHPEDLMRCPIHFCLGQELLAASLSPFLRKSDYILSHHRSHGYYIAKGCPVDGMVSEFYGKEGGSNYGLAGSQELSYSKLNFFSGTILSGMFSIALGTAFSQKTSKNKDISITVIGDGGMEEGICYETLNLASLHKLPILFICENNRTSVHTGIKDRTLSSNFKKKVKSFDIEYLHIKSDNLENIFDDISKCVNKVRDKCMPIFVEFETFRISGHVGPENDDEEFHYRDKDLEKWKNSNIFLDHIEKIKDKKKQNYLNKKFTTIEKNIKQSVIKAKKEKEMSFDKSMKLNFIKSFSKKINKFSTPKKNFFGGQKETKLLPY
jgi:TPP-dependent pyruvate/acetoin dehydrogenase alpha subunit